MFYAKILSFIVFSMEILHYIHVAGTHDHMVVFAEIFVLFFTVNQRDLSFCTESS